MDYGKLMYHFSFIVILSIHIRLQWGKNNYDLWITIVGLAPLQFMYNLFFKKTIYIYNTIIDFDF